jgi:uncharacterized membrane protein
VTPIVRKLSIALAVSVALNLFALGFLAARGFHGHGRLDAPPHAGEDMHMRRGGRRAHGFDPYAAQLSEARRTAMRGHRQAIADARRAVSAALAAEPFDRAALQAALQALRAQQAAAGQAAHDALVELAAKLDAPSRRALAERGPGFGHSRRER